MIEAKRKKVLFAVFIAALIFGVLMKPWEHPQRRPPTGSAVQAASPRRAAAAAAAAGTAATPIVFAEAWPDDPFRVNEIRKTPRPSAPPRETSNSDMRLQGIMSIDGTPMCVINGRPYRAGARVEGWVIAGIDDAEVRLKRAAEELRLKLP